MRKALWTDELIKQKIREVQEALGLDRMPTAKECESYFESRALTSAVIKRSSWRELAREMGYGTKQDVCPVVGRCKEVASKMLKDHGFSLRTMMHGEPYGFLVDGCVKVCVKASKLFAGDQRRWQYELGDGCPACDVYVLIGADVDGTVKRVFVIPSTVATFTNTLSIYYPNSRYNAYCNRWDIIKEMSDFWKKGWWNTIGD